MDTRQRNYRKKLQRQLNTCRRILRGSPGNQKIQWLKEKLENEIMQSK